MFKRAAESLLKEHVKTFPAVVLTGARQVGKTTLLKNSLSKTHRYVLLEDPDVRAQAQEDPRSFLKRFPPPVIFDEFQYVPDLTSYLQGIIDEQRDKTGLYILTGSQNFLMMKQVSQSLAGRVALLSLYGLHTGELPLAEKELHEEKTIASLIYRGTFPELWQKEETKPEVWFGSYLRTYIERDVRNLTQVGDISVFERFVRLCAIRTGQQLNLSGLARDCGISPPTAQRWLSMLVATYQIHLVEPFYENLSSRIKKAPKLYFLDPGLASYLMGFRKPELLPNSPQFGALFETLVVTNFLKQSAAAGEIPEFYYMQTKTGLGVDLILRNQTKWDLYEIKYCRTFTSNHIRQLKRMEGHFGKKIGTLHLLSPVPKAFDFLGVHIQPWHHYEKQKK